MSGSRRIRNELATPSSEAMAGTRSATWRERLRASVLMARTASWMSWGWSAICCCSSVLLMTSASCSSSAEICCCCAWGITVLSLVRCVKLSASAHHGRGGGAGGEPRLHGVVLQRHLQEQRQDDHRPTEGDLLEHLLGNADAEVQVLEQVRIQQGGLTAALARDEPIGQRSERHS